MADHHVNSPGCWLARARVIATWQLPKVAGASWVLPHSMVWGSGPADCESRKTRGGDSEGNWGMRWLFGSITTILYAFLPEAREAIGFGCRIR